MIPQNTTPVERILASLDEESSEAEDYSASETELSPIAEIERLPLARVTAELNEAGLNYLAGLERVHRLVLRRTTADIMKGLGGASADHKKEDHANPVSHDEKRKIFERHFLFRKLNASEIDTLIRYSRVERYPAGREIFPKGSPGQSLMAVLRGSVKISSLSDSGKEIVFTIFSAGDIFGEIAVLDGAERSADATAMTDCELLVLNRRELLPVLENRADLLMILLKMLCRKLRLTTEQVEDVTFRHLESRVAKALVQLAEGVGPHSTRRPSVELHVSQRELGNMAGGSRESVNKQLQIWHRQGLIDLGKSSIMIRDVEAIKRLT
jgi:CRP/FNR family transcriptional regulator, cyclic AMP receptor protein